jgi:hypothetical protein
MVHLQGFANDIRPAREMLLPKEVAEDRDWLYILPIGRIRRNESAPE